MKILIADDDPTSRLVAQAAVRSLGHECDVVTDGDDAWRAFKADRPDVVISDLMMPRLSGLELCRDIRAEPGSYTYFIMVTGHRALDEILEGMDAGADDYLFKPLDPNELRARLIGAARVTSLHHDLEHHRLQLEGLNRELTAIARRDALTGLGNRRALQEDLDLLEARVARYAHRYCLAVLDVDHFKAYNDRYGHQAGDLVLQQVTTMLKTQVRSGDALYRYGGEEFLCIFPEQSLATGSEAVERMRIGLQQLAIPHGESPLGVLTVSAGLAMLDPAHLRSVGEVLKEADESLYRAKELGRNRVEHLAAPVA